MSILSLPSEIDVKIATHLDTTRNLANFKMSCAGIYNAIESEKVDRKRLPHLKIEEIEFSDCGASQIVVSYRRKHESTFSDKKHLWDPLSTKLRTLIQHWILEDDCHVIFGGYAILNIQLLKSLLEIGYGEAVQCQLQQDRCRQLADRAKIQEALPCI